MTSPDGRTTGAGEGLVAAAAAVAGADAPAGLTETAPPGAVTAGDIPVAIPNIGELERQYVLEALDSGFVSTVGPFVRAFEVAFADAVGAKYAIACASGTAALHIAMRLVGVRQGDLVAVSDFTFIASTNAVVYEKAIPLLVDSDERTWCMDPNLLLEDLERRVRRGEQLPVVVEPVHILGQPADVEPLLDFCAEHGIAIIEDAAESLGAGWSGGRLAGRQTGTIGTVGAYSFNGNKIMTTGGGGMIVTDDEALAIRAKHLTTQAKVPDVGYLHDEIGYNYRLTNLSAALGMAQLERLPGFVDSKRRTALTYDEGFADLPVTTPPRVPGMDSTYWLYSILVPESEGEAGRDALLAHLREDGVQARTLWRPLSHQPPLVDAPRVRGGFGASLFERGLSLPCATQITDDERARVVESVRRFYGAS